jgi:hypothetical protein
MKRQKQQKYVEQVIDEPELESFIVVNAIFKPAREIRFKSDRLEGDLR